MSKRAITISAAVCMLLAFTALAWAVCPISADCPLHANSRGYFIRNETIDGVFVGIYKCPYNGHEFIVRCN